MEDFHSKLILIAVLITILVVVQILASNAKKVNEQKIAMLQSQVWVCPNCGSQQVFSEVVVAPLPTSKGIAFMFGGIGAGIRNATHYRKNPPFSHMQCQQCGNQWRQVS